MQMRPRSETYSTPTKSPLMNVSKNIVFPPQTRSGSVAANSAGSGGNVSKKSPHKLSVPAAAAGTNPTPRSVTPTAVRSVPTTTVRREAAPAAAEENVHVAIRVRSFLDREKRAGAELAIRMKDPTCELTLPNKSKARFTFDKCFWSNELEDKEIPFASQEDIFKCIGIPVVDHAMMGLNASIIAYGQTGSGKTYSLFGPENMDHETKGIIPRICEELFQRLNVAKAPYKVTCSMIEIYMERCFDLLASHHELEVRGDLQRGFSTVGAKKVDVTSYADIDRLLTVGDKRKTYGSTAINERSSRAHTLFEVNIRMPSANGTKNSRLMLVDLAGSERVKESKTEGKAFEQACNINLSLLNLGRCIEAVVAKPHGTVMEYRHSQLTKLLKESLGGNSKTIVLATVSPSISEAHHTMHALRFADRAKQIKTHAHINEDALSKQDQLSEELRQLFEERMIALKKEYELECKQQEINKRQLQLEEESLRLEAEREALVRMKDGVVKMTQHERTKLEEREAELNALQFQLHKELAETQAAREECDKQLAENVTANALILADKKAVEEELSKLQEAMDELQIANEEDAADRRQMLLRAEEQLRLCQEGAQLAKEDHKMAMAAKDQQVSRSVAEAEGWKKRSEASEEAASMVAKALAAMTEERDQLLKECEALRALGKSQAELATAKLDEERKRARAEVLSLTQQISAVTEESRKDYKAHAERIGEMEKTMASCEAEHALVLEDLHNQIEVQNTSITKLCAERDNALQDSICLSETLDNERAEQLAAETSYRDHIDVLHTKVEHGMLLREMDAVLHVETLGRYDTLQEEAREWAEGIVVAATKDHGAVVVKGHVKGLMVALGLQ